MKREKLAALLLALLLLSAAGCAGGGESPGGVEGPVLWFLDARLRAPGGAEELHGPALKAQPYEGQLRAEDMMSALLAGPTGEGLSSPFPQGVSLRGCQLDGERPGVLRVSLSEQYGSLADVSLTLADYCIVLTLSQIEGVEEVEILSGGLSFHYRSHQLLSAGEAVLYDPLLEHATPPAEEEP